MYRQGAEVARVPAEDDLCRGAAGDAPVVRRELGEHCEECGILKDHDEDPRRSGIKLDRKRAAPEPPPDGTPGLPGARCQGDRF